jgi:hypothetical protein
VPCVSIVTTVVAALAPLAAYRLYVAGSERIDATSDGPTVGGGDDRHADTVHAIATRAIGRTKFLVMATRGTHRPITWPVSTAYFLGFFAGQRYPPLQWGSVSQSLGRRSRARTFVCAARASTRYRFLSILT